MTDVFPRLITDVDPEVVEHLDRIRSSHGIDDYRPPDGRLWFDEGDISPTPLGIREELQACFFCGCPANERCHYQDHCHETGLARGLLCSGCNTTEGFQGYQPWWREWQLSAPWLEPSRRWVYRWADRGIDATEDEIYELPMDELLERGWQKRQERYWDNLRAGAE